MSEQNKNEVTKALQQIQKKLTDQSWIEQQDPDFIEALKSADTIFEAMGTQIYIFVSYFEQYVQAVSSSPLFSANGSPSNDSQSNAPTQTIPDTIPDPALGSSESFDGNRAERRSKQSKQFKKDEIKHKGISLA